MRGESGTKRERGSEGHFSWGNGEMAENGTSDDSDEENGPGGREGETSNGPIRRLGAFPNPHRLPRRMFSSVECTNVGFSCTIAHLLNHENVKQCAGASQARDQMWHFM